MKCTKCSKDAVIELRYAHKLLCKRHFLEYFERRVKRTIREFHLLKKGEKIGVALSGGKDSTVALWLLKPIADELNIKLIGISVDEGIKGYRDVLLKYARANCKKLGVDIIIKTFKNEIGISIDEIAKMKERGGICSYCGVFRRWILNKSAKELGLNKIVVGHNLDDVAQTVFMNILRNEPLRLARFGPIGGIAEEEGFVSRIKPLFKTPEREVGVYALLKNINLRFAQCPYAEEAFRSNVRRFLNEVEEKFPGTKFMVLNSFLNIKGALIKICPKPVLFNCCVCGELSSAKVCKRCILINEIRDKIRGERDGT